MAPTSWLYPLHYSRRPQAIREPLAPPPHQQLPTVKTVAVAPLVNSHPMTTWTGMVDYMMVSTLMDTQAKVFTEFGPPVADSTHFMSLAGALQYLTFTRPDITYVV
jgi:hypothetical protein